MINNVISPFIGTYLPVHDINRRCYVSDCIIETFVEHAFINNLRFHISFQFPTHFVKDPSIGLNNSVGAGSKLVVCMYSGAPGHEHAFRLEQM